MRVRGAIDIRTSLMDGRVDHVSCPVEQPQRTRLRLNVAIVIDKDQILSLNEREMEALCTPFRRVRPRSRHIDTYERVDPEAIWPHGILTKGLSTCTSAGNLL